MIQTSTLRPGLLVSLKTSIRGNVSYQTRDIEGEHTIETGAKKAKWETERTISDPAEHEAAIKARSKVRTIITGVCAQSAFGLLCPDIKVEQLDLALKDARRVADEFNKTARLTRLTVYVMTGRIAPDDLEATKAISSEVRNLLENMTEGLRKLDAKAVREAANQARAVGQMLSPEMQARVQIAIDAARESAKRIVAAGEQAAMEIDQVAIRKIAESRTAFLDLDEAMEVKAPVAAEARGIDLNPDDGFELGDPMPVAVPAMEI